MTDIDPLVERLHLYGGVRVPEEKRSCSENVCMEAADRIQSDAKIIEELRAAFDLYGRHISTCEVTTGASLDCNCGLYATCAALEPKKEQNDG